jgi:general secretion pathway protein G
VELLIVIAIISVLLSLISSAVWKALVTANRVRNQNEISQLSTAVESFKQKFGIYPPSRILLGEQITDYFKDGYGMSQPRSQFHQDSFAMLTTIFPRLNFRKGLFGIHWDGQRNPTGPVILEGDQCLVFFLGGIPQFDQNGKPFCSGFSTNPEDPTYHVTTKPGSDTIPLFFEFDSSRLVQRTPPSAFLSYRDTYATRNSGTPYAYFSSYKTRNGYNRYFGLPYNLGSSDCTSLNLWPYAEGPITGLSGTTLPTSWRYLNPNTFQIISAGADGTFGKGSNPTLPNPFWSPDRAGNTEANRGTLDRPAPAPPQAGLDDQSNFYDSTLGTGS